MSANDETQSLETERNFIAFDEIVERLLVDHEGRWALLRRGELVDIYDTIRDAHTAAWKLYSDHQFSVQEITRQPVDLGFFSHADHQGTT